MDEKQFRGVVSCYKMFHKFHEKNSDWLLRRKFSTYILREKSEKGN